MADNQVLPPLEDFTGAADEIGGVKFQRVKIAHVAARVDAPTLTAATIAPTLRIDTDAGTVRRPLTHAGTLRRLDA
jgi:hypothetical protein